MGGVPTFERPGDPVCYECLRKMYELHTVMLASSPSAQATSDEPFSLRAATLLLRPDKFLPPACLDIRATPSGHAM